MQEFASVNGGKGAEDRQGDVDRSLNLEIVLVLDILVLKILLVGLAPQILHRKICCIIILKYATNPNDSRLFGQFPEHFSFMTKRNYRCVEIITELWLDPDRTAIEAFSNFPRKELFDRDYLFVDIVPGTITDAETAVTLLTPQDIAIADRGPLGKKRG